MNFKDNIMKNIFISSTFKDMQYERDTLNTMVLPGINKMAEEYGDSVMLTDLRWGINTADMIGEEADAKILDACLGEIDNCRPYMIVFLGGRYGWIPDGELMRYTVESHTKMELESYDISVTQLEIEYGALCDNEQLSRTLFYFRRDEGDIPEGFCERSPEMQQRLKSLKERIKSYPGARVREYEIRWESDGSPSGMEELAEIVSADLAELLSEDWDRLSDLSAFEMETNVHKKYAERGVEHFIREHTNIDLAKYILNKKQPLLVVHGGGTTAFLRTLSKEREGEGAEVLPIFAGLTPDSSDGGRICETVKEFLTLLGGKVEDEHFGFGLDEKELYKKRFLSLIESCGKLDKKIEIIIDGADMLGYADIYDLPFIPERIPENMSIVLGASDRGYCSGFIPNILAYKRFDYFDARRVAAGMLSGSRKELADAALREIFRKKDSGSPLYLELMMRRLSIMEREDFERIDALGGGIEAITLHQAEILKASDESLNGLIYQLAEQAGARIDPELSHLVIGCICAAGYGINEGCLRRLSEAQRIAWSQIKFRLLMQYMDGFFYSDAVGRYRLRHPSMLHAVAVEKKLFSAVAKELEQSGIDGNELDAYVRCCIGAEDYRAYLDILLRNRERWSDVARSTAKALKDFLKPYMHSHDKDKFLDGFTSGLICCMNTQQEQDVLRDFVSTTLYRAFEVNSPVFRHTAFNILGDWSKVNACDTRKAPRLKPIIEEYAEACQALIKEYKAMLDRAPAVARVEHSVPQEFRENEICAGEHRIYFFNVPAQADSTLFLMLDDVVLLKFFRSGVGDHCTYSADYDETQGRLTVAEADFCHYDIETTVTTYVFDDPVNHPEKYTSSYETKRGAYNLPLYFKVR